MTIYRNYSIYPNLNLKSEFPCQLTGEFCFSGNKEYTIVNHINTIDYSPDESRQLLIDFVLLLQKIDN